MNRVEELYTVSLRLKELLNQPIDAKKRPDVVEQVTQLVEKRGKLIEHIVPPYSEDEVTLGQKLIELNKAIEKQMLTLFDDLKLEMKQMKKQKKSKQSYMNPYKHVQTMDGMFMDQKK